jgi:hypothetical protein
MLRESSSNLRDLLPLLIQLNIVGISLMDHIFKGKHNQNLLINLSQFVRNFQSRCQLGRIDIDTLVNGFDLILQAVCEGQFLGKFIRKEKAAILGHLSRLPRIANKVE